MDECINVGFDYIFRDNLKDGKCISCAQHIHYRFRVDKLHFLNLVEYSAITVTSVSVVPFKKDSESSKDQDEDHDDHLAMMIMMVQPG